MKTKCNPLKLNGTRFNTQAHKKGRYVKCYYFSNGLGASVALHDGTYGGQHGYFELAILKYPHGTDPDVTSEIICDHPIHKRYGAVEVFGWLDFHEVASKLQEIRNYNTGDYDYNEQ